MNADSTALSLTALDSGRLTVHAAEQVVGATGECSIPFPAFLIEHRDGLVLFDTGLSPRAYDDPDGYFAGRMHLASGFTPEKRIDRQLATLGYACRDVAHVVLSHCHSDHAGDLHRFAHARYYVGPGELDWARTPSAAGAPYIKWHEQLEPALGYDWTTIDTPRHDLLGDGSIIVLHTPGHTPGHLSLQVALPTRTVVLTADAAHLREGVDRLVPAATDDDPALAVESLRMLRGLEEDGAELWVAHDPGDWERYGALRRLT
ncbi:MAG: N-acyl homoserine lactonase family protein [Salinibacterium sp.]|nr:N-acyl homoserine lactonase family protein [Salinibacterium sp.]MBF0672501.1 N-acyl homoserine lactonase family protein [Salinibacterium sp.]